MSAPTGEDLASLLDALRIAVGEVDALAAVVVESFDNGGLGRRGTSVRNTAYATYIASLPRVIACSATQFTCPLADFGNASLFAYALFDTLLQWMTCWS